MINKLTFLAFSLLIILSSCSTKEEQVTEEDFKVVEEQLDEKIEVSNADTVFFKQKDELGEQVLAVVWKSDDKIAFRLSTNGWGCDFSQSGTAVSSPSGDFEMDEDEAGEAYPAIEYIVKEKGQLFSIRIDQEKRNKAKISFQYETPADECDPDDQVAMRRVK